MNSENDFNKITDAITASKKYENVIHDVCHMPHITSLKEFFNMYKMEENAMDEKYDTMLKNAPTIELFAEAFKKLEEYPSNLQKLKKTQLMRERLNSNISKSSPTLNDSNSYIANKENSVSLVNLNKLDDVPTASETLSDFVKFQKNLKQLSAEIEEQGAEDEYIIKLKQLTAFAHQLEKLVPTEKNCKSALTSEELIILEDLINRMDDLNFIRTHHNVSRLQYGPINNVAPKLDSLVDVLSYCLLAVCSFNIN